MGEKAILMENGLIKAVVVPSLSGRIAVLQDVNGKNLMMEYEYKNKVPYWKSGNLAGYNDMIRQEGVRKNEYAYKCTSKEAGKSGAVLELQLETANKVLVRRMTLAEGSRVIDMEIKVTSRNSEPVDWSYWTLMQVAPGGHLIGENTVAFVPAAAGKSDESGGNNSAMEMLIEAGYNLQDKANLTADTLLEGAPGSSVSFNVKHGQPWRVVMDTKTNEGLGTLFVRDEVKNAVAYFCSSAVDSTMEVVFPKRTFNPGDTASYHVGLAALRGLERVDWMDQNMAVACKGERLITLGKDGELQFCVLPLQTAGDMKLSVLLRNVKDGMTVGPWTAALKGRAADAEDVSVKLTSDTLQVGVYEVLVGEKGKAMPILGRLIKVTK